MLVKFFHFEVAGILKPVFTSAILIVEGWPGRIVAREMRLITREG